MSYFEKYKHFDDEVKGFIADGIIARYMGETEIFVGMTDEEIEELFTDAALRAGIDYEDEKPLTGDECLKRLDELLRILVKFQKGIQ